jgi:eight-cysteine-cluster-containing protein
MCIDPETSEMYYKKLEFMDLGEYTWMESETTSWSWGTGMEIEKPDELVEDGELYSHYTNVMYLAEDYLNCLGREDQDECIAESAVLWKNAGLCKEAGTQKDFCYINAGLAEGDPEICLEVSEEMRDVCYIEFANLLEDFSLCGNIVNSSIREQCLALNSTVECSGDADCARAGCSSELCVPASEAIDIVTACEYLPEYACLVHTTCGCVEGKCQWRENPEYLNCLNQTR